jgi:hypothetical protein
VIAGNNLACRDDGAIGVGYGDDIAGFRFLASLIGDIFAPFLAALWLPSRLRIDKFN